jgi:hypothetical protein
VRAGRQMREEVQAERLRVLDALDKGLVRVEASHLQEVGVMFLHLTEGVRLVAGSMEWTGLRAPAGASFILSDHPLAMCDRAASWKDPVAWLSSPTVEVTLPVDPTFCLRLKPGPPVYREHLAAVQEVLDVNLRTYAWGHWGIYGPSVAVLQPVRAEAKRRPERVAAYEPHPPRTVIIERFEGDERPFNVIVERPPIRAERGRGRRRSTS